jgi:hypothetical protein
MATPVKLATPYPTIEDAAEVYGISPSRLQRLKKMVQALLARNHSKARPVAHLSRKTSGQATRSRVSQNSYHAQTKKRTAKATQ